MWDSGVYIHEEDFPPCERPVLVIQWDGSSAFDEKGDEDLDAVDELLCRWIRQLAGPDLEVATSAGVAIDELSGRFPIHCSSRILLNLGIVRRGVLKAGFLDRISRRSRPDGTGIRTHPLASIASRSLRYPTLRCR